MSGGGVGGPRRRGRGRRTAADPPAPFRYCLNGSTIRGQNLSLAEEVEVAAAAGYQAFEPWVARIQEFAVRGGSLRDLRKRIADLGLTVESAIGFDEWIPESAEHSRGGIEGWKRSLDLVASSAGGGSAPAAHRHDRAG